MPPGFACPGAEKPTDLPGFLSYATLCKVRDEGEEPDAAIIADVLAGQRDRYALLVRRYQAQVQGAMWRLTNSRDQAEELTQAVFVRAYVALASFKVEYRLSTWLIRSKRAKLPLRANMRMAPSRIAR